MNQPLRANIYSALKNGDAVMLWWHDSSIDLKLTYKGNDRIHGMAKIVQLSVAWHSTTEVHHYYNILAEL